MSGLTLTLTRFAPTKDGGFGRLGQWITVEEEWENNLPRISCIPAGSYRCVRSTVHRGGYGTFEVMDVPRSAWIVSCSGRVPGRSLIKFHRANTEEDLLGCIGIGLRLGILEVVDEDTGARVHKLAALSSRTAFEEWMGMMEGVEDFELRVVGYGGDVYDD